MGVTIQCECGEFNGDLARWQCALIVGTARADDAEDHEILACQAGVIGVGILRVIELPALREHALLEGDRRLGAVLRRSEAALARLRGALLIHRRALGGDGLIDVDIGLGTARTQRD